METGRFYAPTHGRAALSVATTRPSGRPSTSVCDTSSPTTVHFVAMVTPEH